MNTEYIRKQLKQAMNLIGNINLAEDHESWLSRIYKQNKLNEVYSIIFDLNKLLKMEEDTNESL